MFKDTVLPVLLIGLSTGVVLLVASLGWDAWRHRRVMKELEKDWRRPGRDI